MMSLWRMFTRFTLAARWILVFAIISLYGAADTLGRSSGDQIGEPVIGSGFPISQQTIDESHPDVAYSTVNHEFLAVWANDRPFADDDIYAQRISQHGVFLSWFNVVHGAPDGGDRSHPVVAYNPDENEYLVIYGRYDSTTSRWDVRARRVNVFGPQGNEFEIAGDVYGSEVQAAVAYNLGTTYDDYLVVWVDDSGGDAVIRGIRVAGQAGGGTSGGELIGSPTTLASFSGKDCLSPDLAYNGARDEYGMAINLYEVGVGTEALVRRISATGAYISGGQLTVNSQGEEPAIAAHSGQDEYFIVYKSMGDPGAPNIWGMMVAGDLGGSIVHQWIIQDANLDFSEPDVARLGNSDLYQVVWEEQDGFRKIRGMRFDIHWNRSPAFDIHAVASDYENHPSLADGSPLTLVVWEHDEVGSTEYDIYGRLLGFRLHLPLITR